MSYDQVEDAEYMADEYEMEDVDDMDEEFHGREMGGSDSEVDEHDYLVCDFTWYNCTLVFHCYTVDNCKFYLLVFVISSLLVALFG